MPRRSASARTYANARGPVQCRAQLVREAGDEALREVLAHERPEPGPERGVGVHPARAEKVGGAGEQRQRLLGGVLEEDLGDGVAGAEHLRGGVRLQPPAVGPDRHEGEPPAHRHVEDRDAAVGAVHGPPHVEVVRQRQLALAVEGPRQLDPPRLAGLEEVDGLAEHLREVGAVDLVEHQELPLPGGEGPRGPDRAHQRAGPGRAGGAGRGRPPGAPGPSTGLGPARRWRGSARWGRCPVRPWRGRAATPSVPPRRILPVAWSAVGRVGPASGCRGW